jgi:hypothetical protein
LLAHGNPTRAAIPIGRLWRHAIALLLEHLALGGSVHHLGSHLVGCTIWLYSHHVAIWWLSVELRALRALTDEHWLAASYWVTLGRVECVRLWSLPIEGRVLGHLLGRRLNGRGRLRILHAMRIVIARSSRTTMVQLRSVMARRVLWSGAMLHGTTMLWVEGKLMLIGLLIQHWMLR